MFSAKKITPFFLIVLSPCVAICALTVARARQAAPPPSDSVPLVTGIAITPQGTQTEVGSYPANMLLSPDSKYLVVTSLGARTFVSVLNVQTGEKVAQVGFNGPRTDIPGPGRPPREGLYYGLAFGPETPQGTALYASRGSDDKISILTLGADGTLADTGRTFNTPGADGPGKNPLNVAGLARSGRYLYAANNTLDPKSPRLESTVSVVDTATGQVAKKVTVPGYPFAVTALTAGPNANEKVYVSSEQQALVSVVDTRTNAAAKKIKTGTQPVALLLNKAQTRLFVANAGSDTVSLVRTDKDIVEKTILLRPAESRGLPGATPTALALSPDEKTLYVTLADMNAVALVDLEKNAVVGCVPVGWYPTAVTVSPDGAHLFVANAKGVIARTPNKVPPARAVASGADRPRYIQNLLEGTVSRITLADARRDLPRLSAQVVSNLGGIAGSTQAQAALSNPGIRHIIYIIKENRTFDQVLGDLPQGNGDPSLTIFGRDVTPNLHALAERFALLDNYYCCAEGSGDGWNWTTASMASEYTIRNLTYGYNNHTRPYDYEGTNNGAAPDLRGLPDVARAPGGYIWDKCLEKKVSIRNYGFFTDDVELPRRLAEEGSEGLKNAPVKRALIGRSDANFRQYDLNYADSEGWVKHGLTPYAKQVTAYGADKAPARISAWRREFDAYVKNKNLPRFSMVRLGNNHTAGTRDGYPSPRAMVADNDYAVGQLVEAVSSSPYWKDTAIFVVEDDAQDGYDHVDAHRSISFVISPFVRAGTHDSRFYNSDSTLRTMENLLGIDPMTRYDANAAPLAVFTARPDNEAPYKAILPDRALMAERNTRTAYRSGDSARLIPIREADTAPGAEMGDILWHSVRGKKATVPRHATTAKSRPDNDD